MKRNLLSSLVLASVLAFGVGASFQPARADGGDNTSVDTSAPTMDDVAETQLDAEFEKDDSQQMQYDNQYAGEQEKITRKELADAKRDADSLHRKNERAQQQIKSKFERLNQEKEQLKQATADLDRIQTQLKNSQAKLESLKAQVNQLRDRKSSILQNSRSVRTDLAQMNRENIRMVRAQSLVNRQIEVASLQLKRLRERHNQMVAKNRALKSQLHKRQVALRILKSKVARNSQY